MRDFHQENKSRKRLNIFPWNSVEMQEICEWSSDAFFFSHRLAAVMFIWLFILVLLCSDWLGVSITHISRSFYQSSSLCLLSMSMMYASSLCFGSKIIFRYYFSGYWYARLCCLVLMSTWRKVEFLLSSRKLIEVNYLKWAFVVWEDSEEFILSIKSINMS